MWPLSCVCVCVYDMDGWMWLTRHVFSAKIVIMWILFNFQTSKWIPFENIILVIYIISSINVYFMLVYNICFHDAILCDVMRHRLGDKHACMFVNRADRFSSLRYLSCARCGNAFQLGNALPCRARIHAMIFVCESKRHSHNTIVMNGSAFVLYAHLVTLFNLVFLFLFSLISVRLVCKRCWRDKTNGVYDVRQWIMWVCLGKWSGSIVNTRLHADSIFSIWIFFLFIL